MNKRVFQQQLAFWVFRMLSLLVIGVLFGILGFLVIRGGSVISWDFITKMPEDGMTKGGIYPAIIGTLCLIAGSMLFALPVGVMSGIYINEYTRDGLFKRFVNLMTNNLAGVVVVCRRHRR